jgi:hypothetical protein
VLEPPGAKLSLVGGLGRSRGGMAIRTHPVPAARHRELRSHPPVRVGQWTVALVNEPGRWDALRLIPTSRTDTHGAPAEPTDPPKNLY